MLLEYFQMIDRVEERDPDADEIVCAARVPEASTVFEGHFPGHPLLPATMLIETMAQASGLLLMSRQNFERLPYLIQVGDAKIRSFVEPDTTLVVLGKLIHEGSGFAVTEGEIRRNSEKIASAQMRFRTMTFPEPALRDVIRQYAASVGVTGTAA